MMTRFETLFVVSVTHAYYGGPCPDVGFVIPADTAQWLRNGKLLARELKGKLYVLFEADKTGVALKPMPGQTLRFGLRLLNPFFSNFTKLAPAFPLKKLLYRNAAAPAALDAPVQVSLAGQVFSVPLSDSARPVTVTLKDNAGLALRTEEITATMGRPAVSYDLTGLEPGAYSIAEAYPNNTIESSYYSDPELVKSGIFGVVEIKIGSGFYGAPPDFQIAFEARSETLKYYVLARNYTGADLNQLSVLDGGPAPISFTPVPSSSFTLAEKSLLSDSSLKAVLFRSDSPVPRLEKARKKIQLKKNNDVLIADLPQPGAEKSNAELVIAVSKP
jgi:hypothetical protein